MLGPLLCSRPKGNVSASHLNSFFHFSVKVDLAEAVRPIWHSIESPAIFGFTDKMQYEGMETGMAANLKYNSEGSRTVVITDVGQICQAFPDTPLQKALVDIRNMDEKKLQELVKLKIVKFYQGTVPQHALLYTPPGAIVFERSVVFNYGIRSSFLPHPSRGASYAVMLYNIIVSEF